MRQVPRTPGERDQTQSPGLAGWTPQAPGGSVASPARTAAATAHPGEISRSCWRGWAPGEPRCSAHAALLPPAPNQEQQPALAGLGAGEPSRTPAPTPPAPPAPGCATSCCDSRSRTITSFAMDWNTCAARPGWSRPAKAAETG